jgi:hypothetical protein
MASVASFRGRSIDIKLRRGNILFLSVFFLAGFFLPGCSGVKTSQVPISDTPHPSFLPTAWSTQSTITPTYTMPMTPAPTRITITPEVTWTPVATLPFEIRKQNLIELFSTNRGCDFPCWWGISPGDAIQKVYDIAPVIGKSPRSLYSFYYYTLSLDNLNLADFYVNFYVDTNQIVQHIEISIGEPSRLKDYQDAFKQQLSLASILDRYGKPSEVLLLVEPRIEPDSQIWYALFLAYKSQAFGIEYSGLVDTEDPIRICSIKLNNYHLRYVSLYMQDPQSVIVERNRFYTNDFKPLDQVTSMSLNVFSQVFLDNDSNRCIETPYEFWK